MPESATLRLDPSVRDRLDALAKARGMKAEDLVAELVFQAETTQVVAEVNAELERLSERPVTPSATRAREREELRHLDATVAGWMKSK